MYEKGKTWRIKKELIFFSFSSVDFFYQKTSELGLGIIKTRMSIKISTPERPDPEIIDAKVKNDGLFLRTCGVSIM